MKIAIIGKGISAIITTLVCISRNHRVDVFYDPDSSHLNVGESTTPHLSTLIYDTLRISVHDLIEKEIVSLKSGIKFINWGVGKDFFHNFSGNSFAFHFENQKLNPFLWEQLEELDLVKLIPEKVDCHKVENNQVIVNEKIYDYIIYCTGWKNNSDYLNPIFSTVNSAILYKCDSEEHLYHTRHKATKDGWEFGLPFPQKKIVKHGYLFDRNINDSDSIKSEFLNKNIETNSYFEWEPRYAKKLLQDKYHAYNGNRLFFIEPLQALSLYYYIDFAKAICNFLENTSDLNFYNINNYYEYEMWAYQLSLAFHYQYGSSFDSPFWEKIQGEAKKIMEKIPNGNDETLLRNIESDLLFKGSTSYSKIGCFSVYDINQIRKGMLSK